MDDQMIPGPPAKTKDGDSSTNSAQVRLDTANRALAEAKDAVSRAREKAGEELSDWLRAAATDSLDQATRKRDRAIAEVEEATAAMNAALVKDSTVGSSPITDLEASSGAGEAEPAQDDAQPMFQTSEQFLLHQLLPLYIRIIDSRNNTWCRQWFRHPEALSRVDALWRAWEHLRLDGKTGMSVWWKDHADPQMAVLLSRKGPFYECDLNRHKEPDPMPCDLAPEGWFPKEEEIPFP